jgi:hypothetical protein
VRPDTSPSACLARGPTEERFTRRNGGGKRVCARGGRISSPGLGGGSRRGGGGERELGSFRNDSVRSTPRLSALRTSSPPRGGWRALGARRVPGVGLRGALGGASFVGRAPTSGDSSPFGPWAYANDPIDLRAQRVRCVRRIQRERLPHGMSGRSALAGETGRAEPFPSFGQPDASDRRPAGTPSKARGEILKDFQDGSDGSSVALRAPSDESVRPRRAGSMGDRFYIVVCI